VSHQADLALLRVRDNAFFADIQPLSIGARPNNRDHVVIVGYPIGGEELSYTSGIVSRIEVNRYAHSSEHLLTIQVDAALNPGNSGGPAFVDDEVVGIAMMGYAAGEGLGYLIPPDIIEHFLADIEDGVVDGHPSLGVSIVSLENRMMRRALGLDENEDVGVMIAAVNTDEQRPSPLRPGDIVLAVDGMTVRANGKARNADGMLLAISHFVSVKQEGDTIVLDILREGVALKLRMRATVQSRLIPYEVFTIDYPYYLYGGFLFTPLCIDYIRADAGDDLPHARHYHYAVNKFRSPDRRGVVILHTVFKHELTSSMPGRREIVSHVNGKRIRDFGHFVELMEAARGWVRIGFDAGYSIKLDAEACRAVQSDIMRTYRIEKCKVL
jgi:hypothetical protein